MITHLNKRAFVFVRHGETDANLAKVIAGTSEAQLTDKGRTQALALRPTLSHWDIESIFVSPQQRAVETACLALGHANFQQVPAIRERNWGKWEGKSVDLIQDRFQTPPQGESFEACVSRIINFLNMIPATRDIPLLICHSGVFRALNYACFDIATGPSVPNATPMLFSPRSDGWALEEFIKHDDEQNVA